MSPPTLLDRNPRRRPTQGDRGPSSTISKSNSSAALSRAGSSRRRRSSRSARKASPVSRPGGGLERDLDQPQPAAPGGDQLLHDAELAAHSLEGVLLLPRRNQPHSTQP